MASCKGRSIGHIVVSNDVDVVIDKTSTLMILLQIRKTQSGSLFDLY